MAETEPMTARLDEAATGAIVYEAGDCFAEDIYEARALGCTVQEGEKFGMWGRWIYGERGTLLVGLCTKTLGSEWQVRAYLARPGYEETVRQHNFKKEAAARKEKPNGA